MKNTVIKVEGLSKKFRIRSAHQAPNMGKAIEGAFRRYRTMINRRYQQLRRGVKYVHPTSNSASYELWALKNFDLEVHQGEVLGILGPNGAGKSTFLKVLSKITPPTTGRIEVYGQIGSLLEVGTGFNPELSGHENIYLYGSILGMDRKKIQAHYDEIVDFAELADFIHQPIKHYSSGMHAKLGFSVAAHLDCEILLIDEILSVGDAAFRRKSYVKMSELINSGRTVLFVSHNMSAINNLCTRAIVINKGEIVYSGLTADAVNHYLESFGHTQEKLSENPALYEPDEKKALNILSIGVRNADGDFATRIPYEQKFSIEIIAKVRNPSELFFAAVYLRDANGQIIVFTSDEDKGPSLMSKMLSGDYRMRVDFPEKIFLPNSYRVICVLAKKPTGQVDRIDEAVELVIEDHRSWRSQQDLYRKSSAIAPELDWYAEAIDER